MWFFYAILSAVFAALTSILAKMGMGEISSNLATAIRTTVVLFMALGMVFVTKTGNQIGSISGREWIFLVLSGLATGASWLCYYKALQIGEVSKVVPVDKFSIVLTIFFAFYVNRRFVFTKQKSKSLVYQLITFFSGRIVVMFADMLITFLAIEKYYAFFIAVFKLNTLAYALDSIIGINYLTGYRLNNLFWICIIQIFAIVFNFIVSKYLSFK